MLVAPFMHVRGRNDTSAKTIAYYRYLTSPPSPPPLFEEILQERSGEGKGQRASFAVHVTDALFLGGTDVRGFGYKERMNKVELMTRSLIKLTRTDLTPVRTKPVYDLKHLTRVADDHLTEKVVKGMRIVKRKGVFACPPGYCFSFTGTSERVPYYEIN